MIHSIRFLSPVLLVLSLGWASFLYGQERVPGKDLSPATDARILERVHALHGLSNWPPAEVNPPADVIHYDLNLTFGLVDTTISGTATVTLVWGSNPGNILHLDLIGLTATSVKKVNGGPYAYVQDADGLEITVLPAPAPGETLNVTIDYHGRPVSGFYVYSSASYTFTEPEESRYWFPCRDVPWDKATLALHGRVPAGKTLVSNGVLESTSSAGGFTTYHWRETHPLATYLMAATISNYSFVSVPSPVTPLGWYVYPGHVAAAATAFSNLDSMMEFFDGALTPYPFDKYVMCEAPFGGGMEHQTATLMGEAIVTAGSLYEWITAHELAHQWFGDYVTLADWRHIWLNESFATFYTAVWEESFYGSAAFAQRMQIYETEVIWWQTNRTDHPILDPPPPLLFSTIEYEKGAWVLRMLRDLMGKPAFDTAVTNYLNDHAFGNATTEDFQAAVEVQYGQPLDWFFDQWVVTGTGRPQILYVPVPIETASGWLAQVDIRQVQPVATTFRLPLEVRVLTSSGTFNFTGWVDDRHDVLAFPVPSEPLTVVVDPNNKILGEVTLGSPTSVADGGPSTPALRAHPNPFRDSVRLDLLSAASASGGIGIPGTGDLSTVDVFDVRGRRVRELRLEPGVGSVQWDGRDAEGRALPAGVYCLRAGSQGTAIRVIRLEGR